MDVRILSRLFREKAKSLGFHSVGFSKAEELTKEAHLLEGWLNQGLHGKMQYMENHFEKRIDPTKLVPGAKTVISLAYNYFTENQALDPDAPKISKYAYGEDYHHVLKGKLLELMAFLKEQVGDVDGRCFVDSAPVLERDWAKRSGLGWIGKNTMLITKEQGSFFFLAEIILDVPFHYDHPISDFCGTCRRCIDACPTDAISDDGYWMDGSKCISYFTIELKDDIPNSYKDTFQDWMFGCDICQDVCPWNRFSKEHSTEAFKPKPGLLETSRNEWEELTLDVFNDLFKKSAVKRTKYQGLMRNIRFLKKD